MVGMLKGLNTLIRLHRRQIDMLRRSMGELERQRAHLQAVSAQLHDELVNEVSLAEQYMEMSHFFGNYAERIAKQQEQIAENILKLEKDMARLAEQIAEQYSELKKFEITRDNILRRQKEEMERKEQALLDEIGVQQYVRQEENGAYE